MRESSHRADILPCIKVPVVDAASDSEEEPQGGEAGHGEAHHDPASLAPAMESGEEDQGASDGAKSFKTGEPAVYQGRFVQEDRPVRKWTLGSRSSNEVEEADADSALDVSVGPGDMAGDASARPQGAVPGAVAGAAVAAPGTGAETDVVGAGAGAGAEGEAPVQPPISKGLLDLTRETARQRKTLLGRFVTQVYVPKVLASVWGQLVVYVVFAGLLAAGIYGCLTVNESLEVRTLITEDTQLYNYLGYEDL